MKMKKLTSVALAAAMTIATFGFSVPANATESNPESTTDYVIKIPAELEVKNAGWNPTEGITAKVKEGNYVFESGKKLTVTATSENGKKNGENAWKLLSGENKVGYNLVVTGDASSVYNNDAIPALWDFSADELKEDGSNKTMGIIVENYSDKPAGNYQDTVTFTASVEDAVTAPTLAGVTLTDGMIIEPHCNVDGGDNWAQFKYVAADDKFVPNFNSYDDAYSKAQGDLMQPCADQWAYSVFEYNEEPDTNFYLTQSGNTVHLRADDGINMTVIDLQLDFDNMTYTQSYKQWYNEKSGSFTSIKIGDTTITASQMTAQ